MFQSFLGLEIEAANFKSDPRGKVSQKWFASGQIHTIVDLYPVCPILLWLQGQPPVRGAALHEAFGSPQLPRACLSVARLGDTCRI